jgi:uncharacterized phage infection (PIP) family protein YhgE
MEKIKKLIPDKISIAGHKVVITEKQFNDIVTVINLQTNAINALIDAISETDKHLDAAEKHTKTLQNSIQALANALKTYTED